MVILCVALLVATLGMHLGITESVHGHDTFYVQKWAWLREIRQGALFGVLIWCLIFVKSEPMWVRAGIITTLIMWAIMLLPLHA